jgi:hypothetical protein
MNVILININQNEIKYIQQHEFNPSNPTQFEMTELSSFITKQIGYKLDEVLLYHSSQLTPMSMIKTVEFPDDNHLNSIILLFKKKMNKHTRKITPFKYPLNQSLRHLTNA